jgi:hypothetical protein
VYSFLARRIHIILEQFPSRYRGSTESFPLQAGASHAQAPYIQVKNRYSGRDLDRPKGRGAIQIRLQVPKQWLSALPQKILPIQGADRKKYGIRITCEDLLSPYLGEAKDWACSLRPRAPITHSTWTKALDIGERQGPYLG